MELFVLRHAIAVPRGTPPYAQNDSARPLTRKGARRMELAARGMKAMGLDFDLILSSPYTRARETAQIVVNCVESQETVELFEPLAAEVPAELTLRRLAARCGSFNSVLLVGHEPQLSTVGAVLLSGDAGLALELKKGGLFKLELDRIEPAAAKLEWWLTPRQLRELGSP